MRQRRHPIDIRFVTRSTTRAAGNRPITGVWYDEGPRAVNLNGFIRLLSVVVRQGGVMVSLTGGISALTVGGRP